MLLGQNGDDQARRLGETLLASPLRLFGGLLAMLLLLWGVVLALTMTGDPPDLVVLHRPVGGGAAVWRTVERDHIRNAASSREVPLALATLVLNQVRRRLFSGTVVT